VIVPVKTRRVKSLRKLFFLTFTFLVVLPALAQENEATTRAFCDFVLCRILTISAMSGKRDRQRADNFGNRDQGL
jgi:hypothetical protein